MRYLFQAAIAELVSVGALGVLAEPVGPLTAFGCLLLFLGGATWMGRSAIYFFRGE